MNVLAAAGFGPVRRIGARACRRGAMDRAPDAQHQAEAVAADAKQARNFAEADRIRDELAAQGIVLKDSPQGTTWVSA